MTTSSSLPSFPSTLSWSKEESAQKVKYTLIQPTSCGMQQIPSEPFFYLFPLPHLALSSFMLLPPCCMSHPVPRCHHHQPSPASSSWCGYTSLCCFVKAKPLQVEQKVVPMMQRLLILMLSLLALENSHLWLLLKGKQICGLSCFYTV